MQISKAFPLTQQQVREFEHSQTLQASPWERFQDALVPTSKPPHPMLMPRHYPGLTAAAGQFSATGILKHKDEIFQRGLALTSSALIGQAGVTLVLQQHGAQLSASLLGANGPPTLQPHVQSFEPSQHRQPGTARIYLPDSERTLDVVAPPSRFCGDTVQFEVSSQDSHGNTVLAQFEGNHSKTSLTSLSALSAAGGQVQLRGSGSHDFAVTPAKPVQDPDSYRATRMVLDGTEHLFP